MSDDQAKAESRHVPMISTPEMALKKRLLFRTAASRAVKIARPVFILEPSGRYRATADMTLGGGLIGSVALGRLRQRSKQTMTVFC
ncbi:MAG: hypothetical protein IPP63_19410 [Chloracidobacterium sp.]|nr:hypothetical protein [Chloracidobacterium sp.]